MRTLEMTYVDGHVERFGVPTAWNVPDFEAEQEWLRIPDVSQAEHGYTYPSTLTSLRGLRKLVASDEVV